MRIKEQSHTLAKYILLTNNQTNIELLHIMSHRCVFFFSITTYKNVALTNTSTKPDIN